MSDYRKRIVDEILDLKLSSSAAVLVEGPKWCGKTTTCLQVAKSSIFMDEPTRREQNIELAVISPSKILSGAYPRLIDEWQIAPQLWDAIRYKADRESIIGGYMITGSAVPVDVDELKHSGTGRFSWLKMRPMSLWESGESSGTVRISELFEGRGVSTEDAQPYELDQMAEIICRGGWPQSLLMRGRARFETAKNILQAIVERDISRVDGRARNPDLALRLMRSYARIQGASATAKVIKADLSANEMMDLDDDTVYSYLNALRKLFIIEDAHAWCPTKQQFEDLNEKINKSKSELNLENNNKNELNFAKIKDNIKDSVLKLFKGNKEEINPQQNMTQQMSLIQIARAQYGLQGISDEQLENAIRKTNGNIEKAIPLLFN